MTKIGGLTIKAQNGYGESKKKYDSRRKPKTSIAEALVRHSSILLIDPGEDSINVAKEFAVKELTLDIREMTVLSVSRKITQSLMEKYDKIFLLDQESQVEEGTFRELLLRNNYFQHLFISNET